MLPAGRTNETAMLVKVRTRERLRMRGAEEGLGRLGGIGGGA